MTKDDIHGLIEKYVIVKIGIRHPDPVVETSSLSSVAPPDVWYDPNIPQRVSILPSSTLYLLTMFHIFSDVVTFNGMLIIYVIC